MRKNPINIMFNFNYFHIFDTIHISLVLISINRMMDDGNDSILLQHSSNTWKIAYTGMEL